MTRRAWFICRFLKNFKSLQLAFLLLDLLDELSRLSLKFQEDSITLSDAQQALEKIYLSLTAMCFTPGPHLHTFLEEAQRRV